MKLGTFKVESGRLHISDPCYKKGGRFSVTLPATKGDWKSTVTLAKNGRVTALISEVQILPKMCIDGRTLRQGWMKVGEVGVDSGSMSICDIDFYGKGKEVEGLTQPDWMLKDKRRLKREKFYGACCSISSGGNGGVLPHGAVTTSGYGDGIYQVFYKMAWGKAIAVRVEF